MGINLRFPLRSRGRKSSVLELPPNTHWRSLSAGHNCRNNNYNGNYDNKNNGGNNSDRRRCASVLFRRVSCWVSADVFSVICHWRYLSLIILLLRRLTHNVGAEDGKHSIIYHILCPVLYHRKRGIASKTEIFYISNSFGQNHERLKEQSSAVQNRAIFAAKNIGK